MLIPGGARFGMDDDVRRNDLCDTFFDSVGEGVDLLEIGGAGDADGHVNEIAVDCAAKAHAFDVENPFDISHLGNQLILHPRGSGVEKRVECAAATLRTDPEDPPGDA